MSSTQSQRAPVVASMAVFVVALSATGTAFAVGSDRTAQLHYLLEQDCGACHGIHLTGGLGPALTPQALAGKSAGLLRATILDGRPNTAMPPWRPFLSDEDADWIVRYLKSGAGDAR